MTGYKELRVNKFYYYMNMMNIVDYLLYVLDASLRLNQAPFDYFEKAPCVLHLISSYIMK